MIVDFHHHFVPDSEVASKNIHTLYKFGIPFFASHAGLGNIDRHIAMMNESGLDISVLTCGPGMYGGYKGANKANQGLSNVVKKYPDRLRFLVHAAPQDVGKINLDELKKWFDVSPGVVVPSFFGKMGLDDPRLDDFYSLLEDRDKYLFVHPSLDASKLEATIYNSFDIYRTVGREFSMVMVVIRFVAGGVLDNHPELKVVISHLGGGLAALLPRIRNFQDKKMWGVSSDPIHGKTSKRPFDYYLRHRLFFDTAGFFGDKKAVDAALLQIPRSRIVPGTDYPQEIRVSGPAQKLVTALKQMRIAHNGSHLVR